MRLLACRSADISCPIHGLCDYKPHATRLGCLGCIGGRLTLVSWQSSQADTLVVLEQRGKARPQSSQAVLGAHLAGLGNFASYSEPKVDFPAY